MLEVVEIKRRGMFKNTVLLKALTSGTRIECEFNSIFVNDEWFSRDELRVDCGDKFVGLVKKATRVGSTLDFQEVENLKPY